ncbi:thioesterase-3 [Neisseria sp. HSC-16F19]|nr:thioesterase family protein [Neisseria sp. HSC-16F19]MCP2040371.1 thioesterase-3 [Neisseria sp. HSC-16F19]
MHQTPIRVRGYHLDVFQHVNNARYLEFLEEARWSYFEDTGLTPLFMEGDLAMAVVNININYRRGALLGDDLLIHTRFDTVNERNAVIAQEIVHKDSGKVVADATVVFVAVDKKHNRAVAFEGEMKAVLQALVAEGQDV